MQIDLYAKSTELLETIANSIHDRESKTNNPFFFSIDERHAVERWLKEFIKEVREDCCCV